MAKNESWKEEAWELFLTQYWDFRKKDASFIFYKTEDLEKFLSKYSKSGRGEIRTFHYGHEKLNAVKKRNIAKIPLTRSSWMIVERSKKIEFSEPKVVCKFKSKNCLTDGMKAGIIDTLNTKTNPGETTLLAIANHLGIIADFYSMSECGVLFTGGRQRAGIHYSVNGEIVDMTKAQIEIDGGFEWTNLVVIVEVKSSFRQIDFDTNQIIIPLLKWRNLLKNKDVRAMVLLAETNTSGLEYWAYDFKYINDGATLIEVNKSKKYLIEI